MHLRGLMWSCLAVAQAGSSRVGWIAFRTQAATQRMSLMHRSLITKARAITAIPCGHCTRNCFLTYSVYAWALNRVGGP